jgi:hypothetical protein
VGTVYGQSGQPWSGVESNRRQALTREVNAGTLILNKAS